VKFGENSWFSLHNNFEREVGGLLEDSVWQKEVDNCGMRLVNFVLNSLGQKQCEVVCDLGCNLVAESWSVCFSCSSLDLSTCWIFHITEFFYHLP
jgi:hypothetical protein